MDRIRLAMDRTKWLWTELDWLRTESNHDCLWIRALQSVEGDRRVKIGYGQNQVDYGQNQVDYGQNQTMIVIGFV